MLEVMQFVFSSFWVYIGTWFLFVSVAGALNGWLKIVTVEKRK